jgi:hypothetical protein
MTRLWKVTDGKLAEVRPAQLQKEAAIEEWLAADPSILGLELMIIGRQVETAHGGRIDLLGLDTDGAVWIVECKRDRTPREIIAQVLDYASWVRLLTDRDIHDIAASYLKQPLPVAFEKWSGESLPEQLNTTHHMVVVATAFDEASRRIVEYLSDEHGVSINAAFFRFFDDDGGQGFLASDWLLQVDRVVERHRAKVQVPWSGYWYVNVASDQHRDWEDNRQHGFVSAGGGRQWSKQLERLKPGAPIYAYSRGRGYVGLGIIKTAAVPAADFKVADGRLLTEVPLRQPQILATKDDSEKTEYVVAVEWLKTVPLDNAVGFTGMFANQHVACRLRDAATLQRLADTLGIAPNETLDTA